jgi:cyclic pyranopterin phosphate synthase
LEVRFLEQMPIGPTANCALPGQTIESTQGPPPTQALIARLETHHDARPVFGHVGNGPASYHKAPHWLGRIGFIRPLSAPYCDQCSRFRITATGDLRPCLSQELTIPLRAAIQTRDARAIEAGLREAAARKSFGHAWNEGIHTPTPMSTLGG